MIIKTFCEKNLSSMGGKIIRYNLCEVKYGSYIHYGIQIAEHIGKTHNKETLENISTNKDFVHELLLYLCENLIDTVHFKDIVEDYLLKSENIA